MPTQSTRTLVSSQGASTWILEVSSIGITAAEFERVLPMVQRGRFTVYSLASAQGVVFFRDATNHPAATLMLDRCHSRGFGGCSAGVASRVDLILLDLCHCTIWRHSNPPQVRRLLVYFLNPGKLCFLTAL